MSGRSRQPPKVAGLVQAPGILPLAVRAVYESPWLPGRLRPVAALMAAFGNRETGEDIYPALDTIAALLNRHQRKVRDDVTKLRHLGVLVATSAGRGGHRIATHYRLNLNVLGAQRGLVSPGLSHDATAENPAETAPELGQNAATTRADRAENPDQLVRRSCIDQDLPRADQDQRAAARPAQKVLTRLAHDVRADVEAKRIEVSEAKAELKSRAAKARIPYDSTAVTKALDSAEHQAKARRYERRPTIVESNLRGLAEDLALLGVVISSE